MMDELDERIRPSYEKIDYRLRPAKQTERKMFCEALRRLQPFKPLESYQYVGFGAIYFIDFYLFHRELGISKMVNIEGNVDEKPRFEFNRPLGCIKLEFGPSGQILRSLDWTSETILWLDYDDRLTGEHLFDVRWFCAEACSGSVLIVTTEVEVSLHTTAGDEPELADLKTRLGEQRVRSDLDESDLWDWGLAEETRRIILEDIQGTLSLRNALLSPEDRFQFKKLFDFRYSDGTRMLTVGGVLYRNRDTSVLQQCHFDKLAFVRSGKEDYWIKLPYLTLREMRCLDTFLPADDPSQLSDLPIPVEHRKRYARLYRYLPVYALVEL